MSESLPDRPDPLDTLVPALRRAGTSEAGIKSFVVHWRTVLARATKRPCPFCYVAGGWGDLHPVAGRDDIFYECLMCKARFEVDGTITTQ
ncbi:MAG TPA: hypothetical protein VFC14_22160 [Burkholderiales bacterium]|jgi:hypothetical protein|nr:hypothetical protein [Burkholderiales bacterium]